MNLGRYYGFAYQLHWNVSPKPDIKQGSKNAQRKEVYGLKRKIENLLLAPETRVHRNTQSTTPNSDTVGIVDIIRNIAHSLGFSLEVAKYIHSTCLSLQQSRGPPLQMHGPNSVTTSGSRSVLTFLMNGHLCVEYDRLWGNAGLFRGQLDEDN